jgi:hypothetical protein
MDAAPTTSSCPPGAGLDADSCLLPWPSSAFLVPDSTTRTGFRVSLPTDVMPRNNLGLVVDPGPWNRADGFTPMTSLLADLPAVLDPSALPTWGDPGSSLAATSPSVIVDVDSGERVAHFDEIDSSPDVAAGHTTLYVRPAARLAEGHHYAVGLRGLRDQDGALVQASAVFAALRDHQAPDAPQAAFDRDVFGPLARSGVVRSELVLAWDFRTASGPTAWGELVAMRDAAFAAAGASGLGCSITSVVEDPNDPEIFRTVEGRITVPSFLDATGWTIARDASAQPTIQGTMQADFIAIVPRTAVARLPQAPAPLWVYGHGLFSARDEVLRDFARDTASQAAAIAVATDFIGLTATEVGATIGAVEDIGKFPGILDRLRQGLVNTLLLPRTIAGACGADPAFASAGVPLVSATERYYFGNSMGGTLGVTLAALSPDVSRFALGVGGADFSVMMPRTTRWPMLELFFSHGYPRRLDRDLLLVMSEQEWELAESSAFAPHVLVNALPGSRPAQVLLQLGRWDSDTTNIASEMAARTLGLPEPSPTAHAVWGLQPETLPLDSACVYYDLGAAPLPAGTLPPPTDNGVHEGVRRDPRAQKQIVEFLRPGGTVVDTCAGPCAPP